LNTRTAAQAIFELRSQTVPPYRVPVHTPENKMPDPV
jgi:hypothetical protein